MAARARICCAAGASARRASCRPPSVLQRRSANIRNQADLAGAGALYDIGCYAIVTARHVFEAEPLRAVALVDRDPALRVDRSTSGLLDFGAGRQLSFSVSMQSCPHQRVTVLGTHGRIEVVILFNAPQGAATQIRIDDGGALDGSGITVERCRKRISTSASSKTSRATCAASPRRSGAGRRHRADGGDRRAVALRAQRRLGSAGAHAPIQRCAAASTTADSGRPSPRWLRSHCASLPANRLSRIRLRRRAPAGRARVRRRARQRAQDVVAQAVPLLVLGSTISPSRPKRQAWKRLKV